MSRHDCHAVLHENRVQLWDHFADGQWQGSRRVPRYLPLPLLLPLPLDCRQVSIYTAN